MQNHLEDTQAALGRGVEALLRQLELRARVQAAAVDGEATTPVLVILSNSAAAGQLLAAVRRRGVASVLVRSDGAAGGGGGREVEGDAGGVVLDWGRLLAGGYRCGEVDAPAAAEAGAGAGGRGGEGGGGGRRAAPRRDERGSARSR